MKKIFLLTLILASLSGCKKYCYHCVDQNGQENPKESCFASEEDMYNYQATQAYLTVNQPHCQ